MEMNHENGVSEKAKYSAIGLGTILLMAFIFVQPVQVSAQSQAMSNEDIINMIEEQAGDLTPEEEDAVNEYLNNLRSMMGSSGGTEGASITAQGNPSFNGCISEHISPILAFLGFNLQPEDAVSMVTIKSGNIAKTIHAEKEIFHCFTEQGGVPLVVEMTIFAEIFENLNTMEIIRKQVEVVTCTKLLDTAKVIGCETDSVPINTIPLTGCYDQATVLILGGPDGLRITLDLLPNHPQEMNVVSKGKIVKVIESQKEIFLCDLILENNTFIGPLMFPANEKKVETVIFTEIWEDLNLLPNDPVVKKTFESLTCVVSLAVDGDGDGDVDPFDEEDRLVSVESCQFSSL